jgi:RND superfamily putative drug exporter
VVFLISLSAPKVAGFAIAAWLLIVGIVMALAPPLSEATSGAQEEFLPAGAESIEAAGLIAKRFPSEEGIPALVVFDAGQDGLNLASALERFTRNARSDGAPEVITAVTSPIDSISARAALTSASGTTAIVTVNIGANPSDDAFLEAVDWLVELAGEVGAAFEVRSAVTGPAGIFNDAIKVFRSIDLKVTIMTVLLVLVLLLMIYRSPILAIVPLIVTGTALMLAQNLAAIVATEFDLPLNQQVTAIMSILVFGAGTNYALFIVSRYREELRENSDRWQCMRTAMSSVGPSIAGSAGTTIVAMSALAFASFGSFRSLGPMLALAVAVVLVSGLFVLPAVITLLGRWAFWPRDFVLPEDSFGKVLGVALGIMLFPLFVVSIGFSQVGILFHQLVSKGESNRSGDDGIWDRAGRFVSRRPRLVFSVTMVGIIIATIPAWTMTPSFNFLNGFPDDAESKVGYNLLAEAFPAGQLAPTEMVIESKHASISQAYEQVAQLSADIAALNGIASVKGPTRPTGIPLPMQSVQRAEASRYVSPDGSTARIEIVLSDDPYLASALNMVGQIRTLASESDLGMDDAHRILVGGPTAIQTDTKASIDSDLRWFAPISLLAVLLVLMVLLRSLVAPIYLVFSVIVSFGATFGISVFVFQVILSHSGVAYSNGVWMFIFLVALGADYNIFVMSRIREATRKEGLRPGIAIAVGRTGSVITSAGIILAGTFAVLTTLPLRDLFQLGFAVMLGVLIDTFVVRTFLVTSMTAMFGRWSWWPESLDHN